MPELAAGVGVGAEAIFVPLFSSKFLSLKLCVLSVVLCGTA
jgi:hypothetical protein